MKQLTQCVLALGLIVPVFTTHAQSSRGSKDSDAVEERIGYAADNIGNGINKVGDHIDKVVNGLVKRWTSPFDENQIVDDDTVSFRRSPDITDSEVDSTAQSFSGNKVIEESETIHNNVVVKGGDLTIYGTVDGDVLVVGGDLDMKSSGKITGNARVVNGSILKEDGAIIKGYEDYTKRQKVSYRPSRSKFSRTVRTFDVPWSEET